jgi:uncharacterized protein VirK/YbjX
MIDRTMILETGPMEMPNEDRHAQWGAAIPSLSSYLVRDGFLRSPGRLGRILWRMAANLPRQFQALQVLRIPAIAGLVRVEPKFLFKYLDPNYLLPGIPVSTRTCCFVHHYRRLHAALSEGMLYRILHGEVTVFEMRTEDRLFAVTMGFSRPVVNEGELSLLLNVDGVRVFILSFNIVPGWVVESQASEVLLIARLQGTIGAYAEISAAMKAMHNLGAGAALVAALQGVAAAFGVSEVAGVCASRQATYNEDREATLRRAYDGFFAEIGAIRNSAGFFIASLPLAEKPLAAVKSGNRLRVKKQRELKSRIAAEVCELLVKRSPAPPIEF